MEIRPVRSKLFHAERRTGGQTNMLKLMMAFRNFAKSA